MLVYVFRSPDIRVASRFIRKHSYMYYLVPDDEKFICFKASQSYQSYMRNEETQKD